MISFRYHVVSIVAVFLAIGLGILVGTTVLNHRLISTLKSRTNAAERAEAALRKQLSDATSSSSQLLSLLGPLAQVAESGRLTGRKAVLVDFDGVDAAAVGEAKRALVQARASVVELSVTSKIALSDDTSRAQLAHLLGLSPSTVSAGTLVHQAAVALGNRLAEGGKPNELPPGKQGSTDVLDEMLNFGFVKSGVSPVDLPGIGGPGQLVVVVAGGSGKPPVPLPSFLVPLVEDLATHPAVWVAAGGSAVAPGADPGASGPSAGDFVGLIRSDPALASDRLVTVDDLDPDHVGGAALVLGVQAMIQVGQGGDYGIGPGSDGLLPPTP